MAVFHDVPESIAYSRLHERKVRLRGYSGGDAILSVVLIVAISEILIWGATIFSYLTGVNTYFEDPVAIAGTADAVSFASAIVAHAGGIVANCVLAAILGAIGSATAVLIPAEKI